MSATPVTASTPNAPPIDGTEEHFAEVDGYRMRYLRAGSGPALLLIHGFMGYSFSWRFNIAALAQVATVYAIDLVGIGFSERPAKLDCCLRAAATRVLKFMDAVGVARADVVGTSHGGSVAMMMALIDREQQRNRIQRLVLVAPANPWSESRTARLRFVASRAGRLLILTCAPRLRELQHKVVRAQLEALYADSSRITPGTIEGYQAAMDQQRTIPYLVGTARTFLADINSLRATLPAIADIPTLLVWGSRDPVVDPRSAVPLKSQFHRAELVILDGVGHLPYEELPEEFNRVLVRFLTS